MSREGDGKKALFTGKIAEDQSADGKQALFSAADRTAWAVAIECSRCGGTTHLPAVDAARLLASFGMWIPGRTFSRRLRCPACKHRAWVAVRMRHH
jgi:DNA-directed RNA polymerase subunit RPC12/RpoP